jgi:excisionase family DNA binding protein
VNNNNNSDLNPSEISRNVANGTSGDFLSLHQAAKMTGYHQDYLGQMARAGKLEAYKIGRNWQTTKAAINKMLGREQQEQQPAAVPVPAFVSAPQSEIQPAVSSVEVHVPAVKKININVLRLAQDAGPNLQEAIATSRPEPDTLPINLDQSNKNIFYHWSKLTNSSSQQKLNSPEPRRENSRVSFNDEQVVPRKKFRLVHAGFGILIIGLAAASHLAQNYFRESPNQTPQVQVAGASTSAVGRGTVPPGETQLIVRNENVEADAAVLIMLRQDYGGRYWITDQRTDQFTLRLSEPASSEIPFDYWIAGGAE